MVVAAGGANGRARIPSSAGAARSRRRLHRFAWSRRPHSRHAARCHPHPICCMLQPLSHGSAQVGGERGERRMGPWRRKGGRTGQGWVARRTERTSTVRRIDEYEGRERKGEGRCVSHVGPTCQVPSASLSASACHVGVLRQIARIWTYLGRVWLPASPVVVDASLS